MTHQKLEDSLNEKAELLFFSYVSKIFRLFSSKKFLVVAKWGHYIPAESFKALGFLAFIVKYLNKEHK